MKNEKKISHKEAAIRDIQWRVKVIKKGFKVPFEGPIIGFKNK